MAATCWRAAFILWRQRICRRRPDSFRNLAEQISTGLPIVRTVSNAALQIVHSLSSSTLPPLGVVAYLRVPLCRARSVPMREVVDDLVPCSKSEVCETITFETSTTSLSEDGNTAGAVPRGITRR